MVTSSTSLSRAVLLFYCPLRRSSCTFLETDWNSELKARKKNGNPRDPLTRPDRGVKPWMPTPTRDQRPVPRPREPPPKPIAEVLVDEALVRVTLKLAPSAPSEDVFVRACPAPLIIVMACAPAPAGVARLPFSTAKP